MSSPSTDEIDLADGWQLSAHCATGEEHLPDWTRFSDVSADHPSPAFWCMNCGQQIWRIAEAIHPYGNLIDRFVTVRTFVIIEEPW